MKNNSSFFHKNLNILESMLQSNLKKIQDEKSSYWKININKFDFRDPESFLNSGSFTKRSTKQKIFHYLNQRLFFSKLLGINIFKTDIYKNSIKIAKKQNRVLDYDFLRMVFTYYFIVEIKKLNFQRICIIGDGKSTLTSIFRTMHPSIEIFYVNLIETTIQDYLTLSQSKIINEKDHIIVQNKNDLNFKKKLYLIPSFNADFLKDKGINLFINICSFQEMEQNILEKYFEIISSNKSILYHCNRLEKKLDHGHIVRTDQYPIKNGKVILNEQCPWHSFYYVPYFKKKYFGGVNEGKGINHFIISFNN
jgi:putative sugar O-methyltransferase